LPSIRKKQKTLMITESLHYECDGTNCHGFLAFSKDTAVKRPAVIVAHAWRGQDDFARQKARELAELGYVGFAADIYGEGLSTTNNSDEALKLMLPFFLDRLLLRKRIVAAFEAIQQHPLVDPTSIGAIGFCFGGLTVIELLRSGAGVSGVVSFHGLLGYTLGEHKAKVCPAAEKIEGALLMLHGYLDPLVSVEDILNIQKEFSNKGVDWQMDTYGQAMHAFSNPAAHDEKSGMLYNPAAAMRSWQAMCNFFEEIFP
jgi:dienelactone hydrolase